MHDDASLRLPAISIDSYFRDVVFTPDLSYKLLVGSPANLAVRIDMVTLGFLMSFLMGRSFSFFCGLSTRLTIDPF